MYALGSCLGHLGSSQCRPQTSHSVQGQYADLDLLSVKVSSTAYLSIWLDRLLRDFCHRWSTLLYSLTSVIFDSMFVSSDYASKTRLTSFCVAAPLEKCQFLARFSCVVYHVTVSSTALLFFFRVRAIYGGNRYITAAFFIMWLSILGASLTAITTISGVHLGNTKYCTSVLYKPYASAANIAVAIFDTCVFLAISWRILAGSPVVTSRNARAFKKSTLFGRYLPQFSRALFQDGQNYYLYVLSYLAEAFLIFTYRVAMVFNLLVLIMTFPHSIPIVYHTLFLVPSAVITNIMACRVFRHTKLGLDTEASNVSTMLPQSHRTVPIFFNNQGDGQTTVSVRGSESLYTSSVTSSINDTDDTEVPSSVNSVEKLPRFSKEGASAV
jgi:hypothetical protein